MPDAALQVMSHDRDLLICIDSGITIVLDKAAAREFACGLVRAIAAAEVDQSGVFAEVDVAVSTVEVEPRSFLAA